MSEPIKGFVVKAVPTLVASEPQWLSIPTDDSAFEFFGSRERAHVFPTQDEAVLEAKRWESMLDLPVSIVVEPA